MSNLKPHYTYTYASREATSQARCQSTRSGGTAMTDAPDHTDTPNNEHETRVAQRRWQRYGTPT